MIFQNTYPEKWMFSRWPFKKHIFRKKLSWRWPFQIYIQKNKCFEDDHSKFISKKYKVFEITASKAHIQKNVLEVIILKAHI